MLRRHDENSPQNFSDGVLDLELKNEFECGDYIK